MMTRSHKHSANTDGTDTSSYEQVQGAHTERAELNRRNEKTPNERDESAQTTPSTRKEDARKSDEKMTQAHKDISRGLLDTDRRGVPDDIPRGRR